MTSRIDLDSPDRVHGVIEPLRDKRVENWGENIGKLVVEGYNAVEKASHAKSHIKINELEALEGKLKSVTTFLSKLEAGLANPDAKEVHMTEQSQLVEDMHRICDHDLLKKTIWTRAEADTIRTALTRHSQIVMQEVHHASSAVNRSIEEGTELLQIVRKILEMCNSLHQSFTSNQRRQ